MANSKQATKRARQQQKQQLQNAATKSEVRTYLKNVLSYIKTGSLDKAKESFNKATSKLDRLAKSNLIHPNRAARLKSRLNTRLKEANQG